MARSRKPCRSRRAWRGGCDGLRMFHTVELSTNTPTGVTAGPWANQGSSARHDRQQGQPRTAGNSGGSCSGRHGTAPSTGFASTQDRSTQVHRHHDDPGRASGQPAGERSFIANPLSLRPIDGLPAPGALERPATLPKERHQPGRSTPAGGPPRGRMRTSTPPPAAPCQPASPAVDHHASGPSWTRWHPLTRTDLNSHGFPARTGRRILASTRRCRLTL